MARQKRTAEKRRAHRLAWRLVDFMETDFQWRIRFMQLMRDERARVSLGFRPEEYMVGATIPDRHLIAIDVGYKDLFSVLIHEILHAMLPEASERTVLALESLVRKHLTVAQARALVFVLHARLM